MVKWIKDRFDVIRNNKYYVKIATFLYPAVLIAFSFCKVNRGLDITDSAYSLSNFRNISDLDGMWFFSTFYSNLLGGLMYNLPGGKTMLGISIYCCVLKCALGLITYYFFSHDIRVSKFYSFAGVMMSLGLCWCPTTILYNYLTYLLFAIGTIMFYKGISQKSNYKLVVAGFVLGSNVFVRLPNVAEAGLIVVLWIYSAINREKFKECLFKTLYCILGYILAFIPAVLGIISTRGIKAYFDGITELMAMTSEAPSYSTAEMIKQLIRAYLSGIKPTVIVLLFAAVSLVIYCLIGTKAKALAEISAFILGIFAMFVLYKQELFSRTYAHYSSMYGISKIAVILIWGLLFAKLFDKNVNKSLKLIIMLAIAVGLICPIGSNNDIYSLFNNMFLILPITAKILSDFRPRLPQLSSVYIVLIAVMMVFGFQSICFGARFVFRDGQTAPLSTYVENNPVIKNMITTADNAKRLTEVSTVWQEYSLKDKELILYGDVSGLGFYLDTDIAISTAWPSLPSFSTSKFEKDINILRSEGKTPTLLISVAEYDNLMYNCSLRKQEILKEYIFNYNYQTIYDNDVFVVMLAQ